MANEIDKESPLSKMRHSLAHVLASAVKEKYPHAKFGTGPVTENGFYYDFDFSDGVTPGEADLKDLEKAMRKVINKGFEPTQEKVGLDEALKRYEDAPYKTEILKSKGEKSDEISIYTIGDFMDPCSGPHVASSKEIAADGFRLDRIAGAYWKSDEKNPMLTRIYGIAFESKEALAAYDVMIEEAKKRDHRKLGKELDLFTFSDLVGSGMPLWTPRGNTVRNEIVKYSRELNTRLGFGEVHTPNINKAELFRKSGHYDLYKDDMLSVSSQYVDDEMYLKPMNCPQHTQIFASQPRSYRDLPIRYSDFSLLYRDERPGELSGLTRLRAFAQDDGHIFCTEEQIEVEMREVIGAIEEALKTYGISYWMRLSFRDPNDTEKYIGTDETWGRSESIMRKLLEELGVTHKEALGEAAFYGPKIDIMAVDAIGREWQISTVQLDLNMPTRFELEYTAEDGSKKTPIMIHRALIGSPDRFLGILIEHYAGAFPLWLSPVQIRVLTVSEKHHEYAAGITQMLLDMHIRVELDESDESLGKKIRNTKQEKVPYFLVIGDKEIENKNVTLESRSGDSLQLSVEELAERLKSEIAERKVG